MAEANLACRLGARSKCLAAHRRGERGAFHLPLLHYVVAAAYEFVRDEYQGQLYGDRLSVRGFQYRIRGFQTPAGFLVDRLGRARLADRRPVLGASKFAMAGLVDSFWGMVAMFAIAGLGNTVYHPADYTLLSKHVPAGGLARLFPCTPSPECSVAAAPASLLVMQS